MLFVELVLIRWAGAYVVYLSYFSNIVLLGSFLGIGIGFIRGPRGPNLFRWWPVALVVFMGLVEAAPVVIDRSGGDLVFFGALQERGLPVWVMLPGIFIATAVTMAMIAQSVAVRFSRFAPLDAYRLDILGSLTGVVTFSLLAFASSPPLVWAIVIVVVSVPLVERRLLNGVAAVALLAIASLGTFQLDTTWSPYYRLETRAIGDHWQIRANGVPHQAVVPVVDTLTRGIYGMPYRRMPDAPRDVLIVGAGSGNDVAAALAMGATSVDAVEIDAAIQSIGADLHPDRPYDDPRVRRIVTDGRAFLQDTEATYDFILFALPDSLTLVAGQSGIRLESYLFTREALEAAREHLRPGGAFAMYNFYREPWLRDRLAGTMTEVLGSRPCADVIGGDHGGVGSFAMLIAGIGPGDVRCGETWSPTTEVVAPAVDDRPFVYLREPTIPSRYLWTLGLILGASLVAVRLAAGRLRRLGGYLDLFFMGAAFLLLETRSIVGFALLFGATWFVNALVFAGILLAVLAAIEVQRRVRLRRPGVLYVLLFLGLALAAAVPASALLDLEPVPRFFAASALAFFPVFVANLVFAGRFRDVEDSTVAFGANLLGAMVGGALEYLALVTGYRALLGVAAILYAFAWIAGRRHLGAASTADAAEPAVTA